MDDRRHVECHFLTGWVIFALLLASCKPINAPSSSPDANTNAVVTVQPAQVATEPVVTLVPRNETVATEVTVPTEMATWPEYTLAGELPSSPSEVRIYVQTVAQRLPATDELMGLWTQLDITGTLTSRASESGDRMVTIEGKEGSAWVWSADPLMFTLQKGTDTPVGPLPTPSLSVEERAQKAEAFLESRNLLDFPYRVEAPYLSRNRNSAVRIVPLIDGIPLTDYDSLNGRLLVEFNAKDEVSVVYWRPLKLEPGEMAEVIPAKTAWEQLKAGSTPSGSQVGHCWQASVLDPSDVSGVASPLNLNACVNYMSGPNQRYSGATISKIELVYFARDLSLGSSPFGASADSPDRLVFPLWRFTGTTDDGRLVEILWPALAQR